MSSFVRVMRLVSTLVRQRPIASRRELLEQDFKNTRIGFTARRYLLRYSDEQYNAFTTCLKRLAEVKKFKQILVDPPGKIADVDFANLPVAFLIDCVEGTVLDLRNLSNKHSIFRKRRNRGGDSPPAPDSTRPPNDLRTEDNSGVNSEVLRLIFVFDEQREIFQKLADTGATVEEVFDKLREGVKRLKIENVSIYRPLSDGSGRWRLTYRTRDWQESSYLKPRTPETTLKSVLEGEKRIFDVDINDLTSFEKEGMVPNLQSIANDLKQSKGSGRQIWIKVVTRNGGEEKVEAVVQLHNRVLPEEDEPLPFPPNDRIQAEGCKKQLEMYFDEAGRAIERIRERNMSGGEGVPATLIGPFDSDYLTEEGLFNPASNMPYPRSAREYANFISRFTDGRGRFLDDPEALTDAGTFAPKGDGVRHLRIKRRGVPFDVEVLTPHLSVRGVRRRFFFEADRLCQQASFDAYGTRGVTYPLRSYYYGRIYEADIAIFIRHDGQPVSFAAMQGYEMQYQDRSLYYTFVHFIMTLGDYQRYGLSSYASGLGMGSLFWSSIWNKKSNMLGRNLQDNRWAMWVAAHSGRLPAFHTFIRGARGINEAQLPIALAIINDAHTRITPGPEIQERGMPISRGLVKANGGSFAVALDPGVYPENTRYSLENGLPQSELSLPGSSRVPWLEAIGGEEGLKAGNGLHFVGQLNFGKIRALKRRKQGSRMENLGKWALFKGLGRDRHRKALSSE